MTRKKRPGRPPRVARSPSERFEMRISATERRAWLRIAAKEGLTLSDWIRGLCNYEVMRWG